MNNLNIEQSISDYGYAVFTSTSDDELTKQEMVVDHGILSLCTDGEAEVEVNAVKYTLKADICLMIPSSAVVKIHSVLNNFSAIVLMTSTETSLSSSIGLETEMFNVIYREPCFVISDHREMKLLTNMIENLSIFAQLPLSAHKKDFVCGMIQNIYIIIYDICSRIMSQTAPRNATYSSADNYLRQFLQLIKENCRVHHDVAFYADKLHITPKYLNEISRRKTQITAKEVITRFIVTMIKRELLMSGNSVQRIAYDFNFCDQSSLGKFFKKATGMSPVAYRRTR